MKCSSCGQDFSVDYLVRVVTGRFMRTTYWKLRREFLLSEAMARMPQFMPVMALRHELRQLGVVGKKRDHNGVSIGQRIEALQMRITEANPLAPRLHAAPPPVYTYRGPCDKDDCRGYTGEDGVCLVCCTRHCTTCMRAVVETAEHTCKAEDIATLALLRKDTRACPKCSARIHRISGCAQMFCTMCHAVFDWNTGQIQAPSGVIHNPHYFEWRTRADATEAADGCIEANDRDNRLPRFPAVQAMLQMLPSALGVQALLCLRTVYQVTTHVMTHVVADLSTVLWMQESDAHIDYLENKIDETRLGAILVTVDRLRTRRRIALDCARLFSTMMVDTAMDACQTGDIMRVFAGFLEVVDFVRDVLKKEQACFGVGVHSIYYLFQINKASVDAVEAFVAENKARILQDGAVRATAPGAPAAAATAV